MRVEDEKESRSSIPLIAGVLILLACLGAYRYLSRPVQYHGGSGATTEAKAYLPHLALSDVAMQASDNFMGQQVIEVKGKLTDNGPRSLSSVDVYCLFYGVNGQEIHRERLPIIGAKAAPIKPGETRPFRLPFDAAPDGWNQALPKMVIAEIKFVN